MACARLRTNSEQNLGCQHLFIGLQCSSGARALRSHQEEVTGVVSHRLATRVSGDPKVMMGKSIIAGTPITVEHISNEVFGKEFGVPPSGGSFPPRMQHPWSTQSCVSERANSPQRWNSEQAVAVLLVSRFQSLDRNLACR